MFKPLRSFTLIELLIVLIILFIMVFTFYTLENYGHSQLMRAQRRTKVQNELALATEHMSKYVQQTTGNINNPGIVTTGANLQVRVDFNQTPGNLVDDGWVNYALDTVDPHVLKVDCIGAACSFGTGHGETAEELSNKIVNFVVTINNVNSVDIDLRGRYNPAATVDNYKNPEVEMNTQVICNSQSTN